MNVGIENLTANVGMGFEHIVFLVLLIGGIIFAAKDVKLTFIEWLGTSAACFIWFYQSGYNYTIPLVMVFLSVILLSLSLFAVNKSSKTGGLA